MDYIQDNEKVFNNIKSKRFLTDSSYSNTHIGSFSSTSKFTIENQNHQIYRSHHTDKSNANDEQLANKVRHLNFQSQNTAVSPYVSNPKRLSSNHVAHKVIDLVQSDKYNSYTNNTIETIDTPAHDTPMYFGTENSTVITAQSGATAHISCIVHHIGECVVSISIHNSGQRS